MANTKKKTNPLGIVILIVVILLIIAGIVFTYIRNKAQEIPADAVGNTSGNLNNRGLFCESDGYVYFSNVYDQRKLYKMKSDGTELKCIGNIPVEFINVYGNQIFFYQRPDSEEKVFGFGGLYGVCSTDINGKSGINNIDKTLVNSLALSGPDLYYQHYDKSEGLRLYKANPKTEDKVEISDKRVFLSTPYGGKFVTYDEENGFFLSQFNPASGQMELIDQEARVYNVIIEGTYLYYMNIDDSYRIYRMNISTHEKEKLTEDRVDIFNVYGDNIFYQRNSESEPALVHMKTDGSGASIVASGNYTNINCTSTYTYYHDFGNSAYIYRVPTVGGTGEVFNP